MKEYDKRSGYIISKIHKICISSSNDRHTVTKTFTPLHYTCGHFISSHLNFTQLYNYTSLHFTNLSFGLTHLKFPTAPFHLTSLHFTSPHLTSLLHFTLLLHSSALLKILATLLFLSLHPVYNCFPKSLTQNFRFTREIL
jgi:hypothetical protein